MKRWCERRSVPRGEVLSLERTWDLSRLWYHVRLSPGFRGRTDDEVRGIFSQPGLNSAFWRLDAARSHKT